MSADLFEQLAQQAVPPVPERFSQRVHLRLNKTLVVVHVVELVLRVLPQCALLFGRAVIGLLTYTFAGRYPHDRSPPTS